MSVGTPVWLSKVLFLLKPRTRILARKEVLRLPLHPCLRNHPWCGQWLKFPRQNRRRRQFLPQCQRQKQQALCPCRAGRSFERPTAAAGCRTPAGRAAGQAAVACRRAGTVTYLLDANTLIEAKNRYYQMSICPSSLACGQHCPTNEGRFT